jgi:hypothetical protein
MVEWTCLSTYTHMCWQPGGLRAGKPSPLTGTPGSDVVVELRRGNLDYYLILKRAAWSYPQASSFPASVSMYLYSPFLSPLSFLAPLPLSRSPTQSSMHMLTLQVCKFTFTCMYTRARVQERFVLAAPLLAFSPIGSYTSPKGSEKGDIRGIHSGIDGDVRGFHSGIDTELCRTHMRAYLA